MPAGMREGRTRATAEVTDRAFWLWTVAGVTVLLSGLFWLYPGIDISVAHALHSPQGFIGEQEPALQAILKLGRASGWLVGAAFIGVLVVRILRPARISARLWRRWWISLLAVVLGPGLLVNGILKAYMGRPRPLQIRIFGGEADFVPVWTYSTGCQSNCSFVSGEASFGLFLLIFAFWFSGPSRWIALGIIGVFGLVMSLNRMAFGAHFLSDVVLAWCLTALVILLIDRYLPQRLVEL